MGIFKSKPVVKPATSRLTVAVTSAASLVIAHYAITIINAGMNSAWEGLAKLSKKPTAEAEQAEEVSVEVEEYVDSHFKVDPEVVNSILKRSEEELRSAEG
jgi:hypothetical protein